MMTCEWGSQIWIRSRISVSHGQAVGLVDQPDRVDDAPRVAVRSASGTVSVSQAASSALTCLMKSKARAPAAWRRSRTLPSSCRRVPAMPQQELLGILDGAPGIKLMAIAGFPSPWDLTWQGRGGMVTSMR